MRIKFKNSMANGAGVYNPGVVYDNIPERFAKAWIEAGKAVVVEDQAAEPTKTEVNEPGYLNMEYKDLKKEAKKRKIKNYHMMKKEDLIKALEE